MLDPAFGVKPSRVQRTSSVDTRKEITHHTWMSLLTLLKPREYFVTVDNTSIWRKHMSWAKTDGKELRQLLTAKFGTNMVFMSLLLGAEMNVLFNSNQVCTKMRHDMQEMHMTPHFWCGIAIIVSVICTLFALLSTFAAWSMVSCISDENSHCMLRSSIGQYCCFLPSRLIVSAIYSFLIWISLFIFIMMPHFWSVIVFASILVMFFHVMTVFSAFGRLIMHSGAMGRAHIFDPEFEEELLPRGLHTSLLFKAVDELRKGTSVTRQYNNPSRPIGRVDSIEDYESGHDAAVHFSDSVRSSSVPQDKTGAFDNKHSRMGSDPSLADSVSSDVVDQWVSMSESADSVERRPSYGSSMDSARPFPVKKVPTSRDNFPPRVPLHQAIQRKSASDSQIVSHGDSLRPGLSKMRPSLLNAGGHTMKSIRRMAESMENDNDYDSARDVAGRNNGGVISPSPRYITSPRGNNNGENSASRNTNRVDGGKKAGIEGTEKQHLLSKPSNLRPPIYTGGKSNTASLPPKSAKNSHHFRGESDPGPSVATMDRIGPGGLRRRTETAELIDIVSKCVSPNEKEDGQNTVQSDCDELESLL